MILPDFVQNTIECLENCGYQAYVVGGAVRDFLLKTEPTDWDIATSALPEDIISVLGEKNCIPTGIKHGTITYVTDKQMLEITTLRIDGKYSDNRRPNQVTFSKSITEDLSRRDFTINAMAYNPRTGITDPFDGQADLSSGTIRTVGEATKRFSEDALRIIRALRFGAVLGFEIEEQTKNAINQCKTLLKNIARERIQSEFSKLVSTDHPEFILTEFSDVFAEFLGIDESFRREIWDKNAEKLCNCPHNLSLRLAVLLSDVSAAAPHQILRKLKYDNQTVYTVKSLTSYMNKEISADPICIKHLLSEIGEGLLWLILDAKRAKYPEDISTIYNIEETLKQILASKQCYLQKDLAVDGNDLIKLGVCGAEIGRILKLLLNEVIEERCENKKPVLIELAKKSI